MHIHRNLILSLLLLVAILSGEQGLFAQAACTPKTQLETYLAGHHASESLVVLAFDHQARAWSGYRWNGPSRQLTDLQDETDLKIPFTNKPRVFLDRTQLKNLVVVVTNTNPLLFSAKPTASSQANIEDLANLQKLAGLLGNFLSATVQSIPTFEPPQTQPMDSARTELMAFTIQSLTITAKPPANLSTLYTAAQQIVSDLSRMTDPLKSALTGLNVPRTQYEDRLRQLKEGGSEIKSYLQLAESCAPDLHQPRIFEALTITVADLDDDVRNIVAKRKDLNGVALICPDSLATFRDAVRLYRIPAPTDPAERRKAEDQFKAALENLADLSPCPGSIAVSINTVISHIQTGPSAGGATPAVDSALRPLFQVLDNYLGLVGQRKEALKAVGDLLAASGDAAKTTQAVQEFRSRLSALPQDRCASCAGVIEVPRSQTLPGKLPWTSVGTEGFQIAADSPFKDSVISNRPGDVSASFEIQRAWGWDFDVDVATIYTEVKSPVYTAVKSGTDSFIRQTDAESRAGDLAMFLGLQWRPRGGKRSLFSVGPQLGAAVSTDHPGLFGGIGFGLGRYVKLGAGWSLQRVKELGKGQDVDQKLAEGEAIRLRNGFDDGYYVSLSITIDELPFFKAP